MSLRLLCYLCSELADFTLPSGITICARCAYQNNICIKCPEKCDKEKCSEESEETDKDDSDINPDPYQFKFNWSEDSK